MTKKKTMLIGCLHLDSNYAIKYRPWAPQDKVAYNDFIIERINIDLNENDQLIILGDISDSKKGWDLLGNLNTKNIILVDGNHDRGASPYAKLKFVKDIQGFNIQQLNGFNIMISHCPIHPIELTYTENSVNIHSHSHVNSIQDPNYLNLSFDSFRAPITMQTALEYVEYNRHFFAINQRLPLVSFDDNHNFTVEGFQTWKFAKMIQEQQISN